MLQIFGQMKPNFHHHVSRPSCVTLFRCVMLEIGLDAVRLKATLAFLFV